MKYLGLVGKKQSGKDTAFDALKAALGNRVQRVSIGDAIKLEICEYLRADPDLLNAHKNLPPFRAMLQAYGVWRRSQTEDYWLMKIDSLALPKETELAVMTDCRFLNEAEWIRRKGGKLIRITRPSLDLDDNELNKHSSEVEQDSIFVDMHIANDQTKLRLEKQIVDVVTNYFKLCQ